MSGSASYLFGPIVAAGIIAVLLVLLRWTFRRGQSVVAAPARPGAADAYGLLVPVCSPATLDEATRLCDRLRAAGIPANAADTLDGPRVLVWPADAGRARHLLTP